MKNYKLIKILLLLFITGCSTNTVTNNEMKMTFNKKGFVNKGFTTVYSNELFKEKKVSKKINNRSLILFQRNLKKGTSVRIKNILNNKSVVAKIGDDADYPIFNNSIISKRIASVIELDPKEPYIEIYEVITNTSHIIKKTKTFDEEKKVADKAPVVSISINNLNKKSTKNQKKNKKDNYKFNYLIKVADFYFKDTAKSMIKRIKNETKIKKPRIKKISSTKYRVFLGPFYDIKTLQKAFNDINILQFENIEIIKNEKNV